MDTELLSDTVSLLQQQLYARSTVTVECDDGLLQDLAQLLNSYNINRHRKVTLLACSMLIGLAIRRHRELVLNDDDGLSRGILDGDYLFGLYYRLAVGRQEWRLITHLTLFNKRVQLALLKDQSAALLLSDLKQEIRTYLDRSA